MAYDVTSYQDVKTCDVLVWRHIIGHAFILSHTNQSKVSKPPNPIFQPGDLDLGHHTHQSYCPGALQDKILCPYITGLSCTDTLTHKHKQTCQSNSITSTADIQVIIIYLASTINGQVNVTSSQCRFILHTFGNVLLMTHRTFSPISVRSAPGSISRSGTKAQLSNTL